MFASAENAAKKPSSKALHLEVTRNNGRAIPFYYNAGFEDYDRYLMTKRA